MICHPTSDQKNGAELSRFLYKNALEPGRSNELATARPSKSGKDWLDKRKNEIITLSDNPQVKSFLKKRLNSLSGSVAQKNLFETDNFLFRPNGKIDGFIEFRRVKEYFGEVAQAESVRLGLRAQLEKNSFNNVQTTCLNELQADLDLVLTFSEKGITDLQSLSRPQQRKIKRLADFLADNQLSAAEIQELQSWKTFVTEMSDLKTTGAKKSEKSPNHSASKPNGKKAETNPSPEKKNNLPLIRSKIKGMEDWFAAQGMVSAQRLMQDIYSQLDGESALLQNLGISLNNMADFCEKFEHFTSTIKAGNVAEIGRSFFSVLLVLPVFFTSILNVTRHLAFNLIDLATRAVDDLANMFLGDSDIGMNKGNADGCLISFFKKAQKKRWRIPFLDRAKNKVLESLQEQSQSSLGVIHGFTEFFRCTIKTIALPEKVFTEIFTTIGPILRNLPDLFKSFDFKNLSLSKIAYGTGYIGIIVALGILSGGASLAASSNRIFSTIGKILQWPGKTVEKFATVLSGKIGPLLHKSFNVSATIYDIESAHLGGFVNIVN